MSLRGPSIAAALLVGGVWGGSPTWLVRRSRRRRGPTRPEDAPASGASSGELAACSLAEADAPQDGVEVFLEPVVRRQLLGDPLVGVDHRGVVAAAELPADLHERVLGQPAREVHADLP